MKCQEDQRGIVRLLWSSTGCPSGAAEGVGAQAVRQDMEVREPHRHFRDTSGSGAASALSSWPLLACLFCNRDSDSTCQGPQKFISSGEREQHGEAASLPIAS